MKGASIMRKRCIVAGFVCLHFLTVSAAVASSIKLTTYAEGFVQIEKDKAEEEWILAGNRGWNPKNFFEVKFDIVPLEGFTIWYKINATTSTDDRNDPLRFTFMDLNMRYQKFLDKTSGFELRTFMREDGYFWIDQPLLRFTDNGGSWGAGDSKGDAGSVNGIQINAWNVLGLNMLKGFIVSPSISDRVKRLDFFETRQFSGALRGRKDFLNGGLKIGLTGAIYNDNIVDQAYYTVNRQRYRIGGLDVDTNLLGPFQWVGEVGYQNIVINDEEKHEDAQWAYKTELRGNFSLGDYGQTGFLFSMYFSSAGFENWRGSDGGNNFTEILEFYYNFPLKAIFLKQAFTYSHQVSGWPSDNFHLWNYEFVRESGGRLESYTELYIEFKYGFKFKSYYKQIEGGEFTSDAKRGIWKTLFFQFEVENAFARIKPQALFLNINDEKERASVFGAEILINLSEQIKFYTRFAMVSGSEGDSYRSIDQDPNWYTFACELQFLKVFSNTEMFLTFGEFGHTGDDLVHSKNGVLAGAYMENKLKFFMKFWL